MDTCRPSLAIICHDLRFSARRWPSWLKSIRQDGSRVKCFCNWQPEPVRARRLTVILVHGLEGSSESRYIKGIAARAWAAGFNVVRMNMRNCGDTDDTDADAVSLRLVVGRRRGDAPLRRASLGWSAWR